MRPSFSASSLSPCTTQSPHLTCVSELKKAPPALAHRLSRPVLSLACHDNLLLVLDRWSGCEDLNLGPPGSKPGTLNRTELHPEKSRGNACGPGNKNPHRAGRILRSSVGSRWDLCAASGRQRTLRTLECRSIVPDRSRHKHAGSARGFRRRRSWHRWAQRGHLCDPHVRSLASSEGGHIPKVAAIVKRRGS